jgi:hypothetical protein
LKLKKTVPIVIALMLTILWLLGLQPAAAAPSTTWYFAEGYTGEGFNTWLTIENAGSTDGTATITYYFSDGSAPVVKTKSVPLYTRQTVDVNADVGSDKEVAIKVESTIDVVVERPMYFNYMGKWDGGHTTLGATALDTTWYFAEGYTGDNFDTWLTLANPNGTATDVTITYMFRGGDTPVTKNISLDATSRETVNVNADVGSNKEVSIKVEATQGIVAERPVYFNYEGRWAGGHNTIGSTVTSTDWYFAEGYTGENFNTWLTLQNPNGTDANATITYYYRGGGTKVTSKTIPANSRETVNVNTAAGSDKEVSIKIASDQTLVAERPVYFNYQNKWDGGHNTIGVTSPTDVWLFAEGSTQPNFQTWLTLQNPSADDATVLVFYLFRSGGAGLLKIKTVPGNSRETIDVNLDVGELRENQDVAIWVMSTEDIIVERPMYFNYQNKWDGGSNSIGCTDNSIPL